METIELNVKNYAEDQTKYFREVFVKGTNSKTVIFPKDKEILSEGVLDGDDDLYSLGSSGEHGIIRLENTNDIHIKGNNATIYADDWLVENLDNDDDGIYDDNDGDGVLDKPGYRGRIQRACVKAVNATRTVIEDLNYTNNNDRPRHKDGMPEFESQREFDHFLRVYKADDLLVKNCTINYVWGDGVYISGNDTKDIKLLDLTIDWNGRQGVAIAGGKRLLFDGIKILRSRRGGFDFESPLPNHITDGAVVQNCFVRAGLLAFPMAGSGVCNNILIQNNLHHASGITLCRATNGAVKKNIIFSGNTNVGAGGGYDFVGVENLLIEGENQTRKTGKEDLGVLLDCKNVWIRNNNFKHDRNSDLYFELHGSTTLEDVHVYGNDNIKLKIGDKIVEPLPQNIVEGIPFEVDPFVTEYYGTANKKVEYLESSEEKKRELITVDAVVDVKTAIEAFKTDETLEDLILNVIENQEGMVSDESDYFFLFNAVGNFDENKEYHFRYISRDYIYYINLNIGETSQVEVPEIPEKPIMEKPKKPKGFKKAWDSGSNLRVQWEQGEDAKKYVLKRRKDGSEWREHELTVDYYNLIGGGSDRPGVWEFELVAVNDAGQSEVSYLTVDTGKEDAEQPETPDPQPQPVVVNIENDAQAIDVLEKLTEYLKSK